MLSASSILPWETAASGRRSLRSDPAFKQRTFPASAGIKQIRVGDSSDKLRFVFDAAGPSLPEYQVEKQDDSVSVTWGKALQGAAAVPVEAGVTSPRQSRSSASPAIRASRSALKHWTSRTMLAAVPWS